MTTLVRITSKALLIGPHLPGNEDERPLRGGKDVALGLLWQRHTDWLVPTKRWSMVRQAGVALPRHFREDDGRLHACQKDPDLHFADQLCVGERQKFLLVSVRWLRPGEQSVRVVPSTLPTNRASSLIDRIVQIVLPWLLRRLLYWTHIVALLDRRSSILSAPSATSSAVCTSYWWTTLSLI